MSAFDDKSANDNTKFDLAITSNLTRSVAFLQQMQ
jgi:hypothetical protein